MICFDNPTLKRGKLKFQDQCSAGHASRPMPAVLCPAGPIRGRYHKIFLMRRPKHIFLYLKWANPGLIFVYFRSFQTQFYRKNCRLQQDSNLDRQSRRQARWPLDHHHGPAYLSLFWSFQQFRLNKLSLKMLMVASNKVFWCWQQPLCPQCQSYLSMTTPKLLL